MQTRLEELGLACDKSGGVDVGSVLKSSKSNLVPSSNAFLIGHTKTPMM